MKKSLLFIISTLSLCSCDLGGLIKRSYSYSDEPLPEHEGVGLNIICNDDLLAKRNGDKETFSRLCFSPIPLRCSTVKIVDGKITFYEPPFCGEEQLREVADSRKADCFFEQEVVFEFDKDNKKDADFIYFTDVSFTADKPNSKIFKNLRVALFDGATNDFYYALSYDKNGTITQTEMALDLNMDGELDKDLDGNLINYTTGMRSYMTNSYDFLIPNERSIESNNFDKIFQFIKPNKPLTIRIWVEGWDLTNNEEIEKIKADINLTVSAHEI